MSKYGKLSRTEGHSKWFLQKTIGEHDKSMDDPFMKMIYNQSFTIKQYAAWVACNHAIFVSLEAKTSADTLPEVYDQKLLRATALETDLKFLLGEDWQREAADMLKSSPATRQYLDVLEADAADRLKLISHHFLQYNAVLSGGAYLGKMVSEKLCLVRGAPGICFYAFAGVDEGKEPARVQAYIKAFDKVAINEEERDSMLAVMRQVYGQTEAIMKEVYELNPIEGLSYSEAKEQGSSDEPVPPLEEQLELSLSELQGYVGADGGRILFSLAGELLDVTAGADMYSPGSGYAMLAGHDVTRCLGTMSLDPAELDDVAWEPDDAEEEKTVAQWRLKLKAKYPVAGKLTHDPNEARKVPAASSAAGSTAAPLLAEAPAAAEGADAACPISGKVGIGCPMSTFGINVKPKGKAKAKGKAKLGGDSGFTAGKSLVAAVEKSDASEDWWLLRLCPLHWDTATAKAFVIVAAASWMSGVCFGWGLCRFLSGW